MLLALPVFLACSSALLIPNLRRMDPEDQSPGVISNSTSPSENTGSDIGSPAGAGNNSSAPFDAGTNSTSPNEVPNNSTVPMGTISNQTESYIVVLKPGQDEAAYEAHDEWVMEQFTDLKKRSEANNLTANHEVEFFNISSFHAYAADIPPSLLRTIETDPLVDFVEKDQKIEATDFVTQDNAPWGLSRISYRELRSPPPTDYRYDTEGGRGVTAYVLDTGIRIENAEFEGRAVFGKSYEDPTELTDYEGHGTVVADVIGGKTYGVAKQVKLVSVAVLDRYKGGSISSFVRGVAYAVREHKRVIRAKTAGFKGSLINLSFETAEPSQALDRAVEAAVASNVHAITGAGNRNVDACGRSPARARNVITVGSVDNKDRKASSSNWGRCVALHAPGVRITAQGIKPEPEVRSGTSLAAPHVSGLVAYLISLQPDRGSSFFGKRVISPAELREILMKLAVHGAVRGLDPTTPNIFAYNGARDAVSHVAALTNEQLNALDSN